MIEDFLKKTKYRKEILMAFPVVGGLFAGYLFVMQPGISKLKAADQQLAGLQGKSKYFEFIANNEGKIKSFGNQIKVGDKTWLTEKIGELAQKNSISLSSVIPTDAQLYGDFFNVTAVRILAEGTFHDFADFISQIESLEQLIEIRKVTFLNANNSQMSSNMETQQSSAANQKSSTKIELEIAIYNPVSATS